MYSALVANQHWFRIDGRKAIYSLCLFGLCARMHANMFEKNSTGESCVLCMYYVQSRHTDAIELMMMPAVGYKR